MSQAQFPQRGAHGCVPVAARFQPTGAEGQAAFRDYVSKWMRERDEQLVALMADELRADPRLSDAGDGVLEVVFESVPDGRLWKDIMVRFTSDATQQPSVSFVGFFDVVAGRWHPAAQLKSE